MSDVNRRTRRARSLCRFMVLYGLLAGPILTYFTWLELGWWKGVFAGCVTLQTTAYFYWLSRRIK